MNRRTFNAIMQLLVALLLTACSKEEPLPELGKIPEFALTDQNGRAFNQDTLQGKTWAAAFMFTRCPTVCPALTRAMRSVQSAAEQKGVPLDLVSFTVDPENDTPAVLSEYARKHDANLDSWRFVTGDSQTLQRTAEQGFKIGVSGSADETKPDFGITHGSHLVLVDGQGTIRGYYRSTEAESLEALVDDAKKLQ